jgi:hypothetical protein
MRLANIIANIVPKCMLKYLSFSDGNVHPKKIKQQSTVYIFCFIRTVSTHCGIADIFLVRISINLISKKYIFWPISLVDYVLLTGNSV